MWIGRLREITAHRQVPLGLLGALVLIIAGEHHVDRNALDYLTGAQWTYKTVTRVAETEARDCGLLCFGDSLMKMGLAPKVLKAETGLRGYNFAIAGGQPVGSYFLLRRALESGARPKAIVVEFFPQLLSITPQFNDENWSMVANTRDSLDLAMALGRADEFARISVARLLPSVQSRTAIRANILYALNPSPFQVRIEILRAIRNWMVNRGAEITPSKPGAVPDLDSWERFYFPLFSCLPINQMYVDRFLDLADSRQIPVFWLLPPYQARLQERVERSGFDARHEEFVKAAQIRHPNLVVVDARHSNYDPNIFVDLHHLGREGAAVYSSEVGRTIARHLSEPGARTAWNLVPPYQARPEVAPIEDGNESRLIVWNQYQARLAAGRGGVVR